MSVDVEQLYYSFHSFLPLSSYEDGNLENPFIITSNKMLKVSVCVGVKSIIPQKLSRERD